MFDPSADKAAGFCECGQGWVKEGAIPAAKVEAVVRSEMDRMLPKEEIITVQLSFPHPVAVGDLENLYQETVQEAMGLFQGLPYG